MSKAKKKVAAPVAKAPVEKKSAQPKKAEAENVEETQAVPVEKEVKEVIQEQEIIELPKLEDAPLEQEVEDDFVPTPEEVDELQLEVVQDEEEQEPIMPGSMGEALKEARENTKQIEAEEEQEFNDQAEEEFNEQAEYERLQDQDSTKEKVVYGDSKRKPNDLLSSRLARQAERNGR